MQELRQSTEVKVRIGSAVDATDGVTPETGLTLGAADQAELLKHNGAATVDISGSTFAAITAVDGWYDLTLTAGNTDTLGQITVVIQDSSLMAPIFRDFMVVTANYWDSKYSTDKLQVDMTQCGGSAVAAGAIPNAAADAAGGLPISDAGGLDLDTKLANTNEITAARMGALTDWINGGRLDLLLDAIPTTAMRGTDGANTTVPDAAGIAATPAEVATALTDINLDHLVKIAVDTDWATTVHLDSVLGHIADVGTSATFNRTTDALEAIRDRGDAAWTTGAGGSDRLLMVDTTIATLASQTSFTLTAGSADDDAYNNCTIVIEDVSTATQKAVGIISDYTGASKTVTLKYDPAIFAMDATDKVYILAENALKATLANRQLNVAADGDIAGDIDGSVASVVGHTAQTGDSYAIVNNASYGNAKLVRSTAPANTLDVSATGEAGIDFANIKDATGAHTLTNITVPTVSTLTGHTAQTGDNFARLGAPAGASVSADILTIDNFVDELESRLTAARAGYLDELAAANLPTDVANVKTDTAAILVDTGTTLDGKINTIDTNIDAILLDTGTDGVLLAATATSAQLVDDVWDEILSGATHNIASSAGRRVREIGAYAIESGTSQAGATNSITLATTASAIDGTYNRNLIILVDNTGVGQTRTIVDYDGATKIAIIDRDWRTPPDDTTAYQVTPDNTPLVVDQGVAQSGTSTTIKLRAYASSTNNIYLCNVVAIIAGTGRGQARLVGSYDGTSKIATICGDNWVTNPDNTSVYVLMPYGTTCTSCIGTYALGLINTECDTALTDYDPPTRTEATADKDAIITEVNANETKIDTVDANVDAILVDTGTTIPGTITTLQTDSTAIKAKTDNLPSGLAKNVALAGFNFYMVLSSDHVTEATGKTIAGTISKDGSAFAGLTNAISEIASGMYKVDLIQAEMNADVVTLKFTEATCDQRIITIYTS